MGAHVGIRVIEGIKPAPVSAMAMIAVQGSR